MTEARLKKLGVRRQEFHYRCQCGGTGIIRTRQTGLAPLVRLARTDHEGKCGDPDIESIETPEERHCKDKQAWETAHPLGEGFC